MKEFKALKEFKELVLTAASAKRRPTTQAAI